MAEEHKELLKDLELDPDVFFKFWGCPVNSLKFRFYRIAMNCGMFLESKHRHKLIREAYSLIKNACNRNMQPTREYLASLSAYLDNLEVQLRNKGSL
jgi:hypothetical protein